MNLLKKSNKIFECNFQKELKHFEHRIMKHDMLQSEVQRSAQKMKVGDVEDEHKHNDLKNKVDNYGRKVGVISVTQHYRMSLIGNARNVMSCSCTCNVSNLYRNVAMLYHCLNVFR